LSAILVRKGGSFHIIYKGSVNAIMKFKTLKRKRLSETIEDSIKELIISGELKPGSKLPSERELSKQFGVSIVTVREALRGLETLGMIQKKRGRDGGILISQASSTTVKSTMYNFLTLKQFSARNLGEVRKIIEPASARIAATQITPDELKGLEENIIYCERMIEKHKSKFSEKTFFDIEERNVEYHRLIAEATHNPVLTLTVDYVEDFLLSFKKSTLIPDIKFSTENIENHRKIYNCIKNGDAQAAERDMLEHCRFVEDYLVSKERNEERGK